MTRRKLKPFVIPIVYSLAIVAFVFSMYYGQKFLGKMITGKVDNTVDYVDGEITDKHEKYVPVVGNDVGIIRPYLNSSVTVYRTYYDYTSDVTNQENSIIYYEGTYMQNSGIDYTYTEPFEVVSILDGTITDVKEDRVFGNVVEIRHDNNIISVYQCIGDVGVKINDTVKQGQVIGKSGKSNFNLDSENNLHFELYYQGKVVNPESYYDKLLKEL